MPREGKAWISVYEKDFIGGQEFMEELDKRRLCRSLEMLPLTHEELLKKLGMTEEEAIELDKKYRQKYP